jgi:ketosteroid isomerase-like protein
MGSTESEIEALLDSRSEAIRIKDVDRLLSFYAPDVVYFDIPPPLQYVGSEALRGRFLHWFESYEGPIRQEIHDLTVLAGGDVAVTSMLIRSGGTLKNGQEVSLWVRATSSFHRSNDSWLITHEHVSLPVDLESGRAVMGLTP